MTIDYGHDIRAARLNRGWSRERLAEESGLSVKAIVSVESGNTDVDPAPIIAALELQEIHLLLPSLTAHFVRVIQPIVAKIDKDRLPITMASVLDVIGRAAAGIEPEPAVRQFNLVTGDVKVEQTVKSTTLPRTS